MSARDIELAIALVQCWENGRVSESSSHPISCGRVCLKAVHPVCHLLEFGSDFLAALAHPLQHLSARTFTLGLSLAGGRTSRGNYSLPMLDPAQHRFAATKVP